MPDVAFDPSNRVLIFAFPAMEESLTLAAAAGGFAALACPTAERTLAALDEGAALLLITTDLLAATDIAALAAWVERQPAWSTLPIVLLVPDPAQPAVPALVARLGTAVVLPETCSSAWLQTAIRSAWTARRRQYEAAGLAASGEDDLVRAAVAAAEIGIWDYLPEARLFRADALCHDMLGIESPLPFSLPQLLAALHPEDRERMQAALAAALDPAGTGDYEVDYRALASSSGASGESRWLTASGKARFAQGKLQGFTGILRDRSRRRRYEDALLALNETLEEKVAERTARLAQEVAERARTEEQLQQSQKMEAVGQLTGGIAHDFNNLLSAVLGNLELLRSRISDPKLLRFAENALQAVNRGARLTAQLLAFSRLRAVSLKPVDLNALVAGLDELLSHTLGAGIVIETRLAPNLPPALADANQLELALLNLAINARDAMQQAGRLVISTARREWVRPGDTEPGGPAVTVAVADNGSGIPPEILAQVFEPFFTTKEAGKGTGLGLAQVQTMVRQCNGLVEIASQPGQGTTVTMILPQAVGMAVPPPAAAGPELLAIGQGQKILVLDDDADVAGFIVESLLFLGYQPLLAADGVTGLVLLAGEKPALAIVDYAMPGMTGAEWVVEARRRQPALPIVFATGHAQIDVLQAAGPEAPLLRKPFRIAALAEALAGALASAPAPAAVLDRSA